MSIKQNLIQIRQQIAQFADRKNVKLLAVSKCKSVELIEEAIAAGQFAFGENYVQEGISKIHHFRAHLLPLEWHFIGALQSNKTRLVAENFDWVQTVDRVKIANRLNEQRPSHLAPLNILIQVNISDEETKTGIPPEKLFELVSAIQNLPNIRLRGLMAIPKAEKDIAQQQIAFKKMAQLFAHLQQHIPEVDTLSMGMSDDMQSAIECGSTMVRIGSAIFGAREYI